MTPETDPRFFILRFIEDRLLEWGLTNSTADLITFLTACLLVVALIWMLNFIGTWVLTNIISLAVKHSRTLWDDFLLKRRFFKHLIQCFTGALLLSWVRHIFDGYEPSIIAGMEIVIRIFITLMSALTIGSFLEAVNDVYNSRPIARRKSIKGIIQTIKLIVYIIAGIIAIAILFRKDPTQLLVGLGASAAILSLVFKDTILGFVASIQISAQDMIHPGDWIEMPSKQADGVVTDINVSNVKVRNWNNTITMIPIYSIVSEAFTNWRGMEESNGRQFRRPLRIDATSVAPLCEAQIDRLRHHPMIAPAAEAMLKLFESSNTSPQILNLGLFRCYAEAFLRQHPKVNTEEMLVVRYLAFDENGLTLELYGFLTEKRFVPFENIVADILNHLLGAAPLFDLRIYQRPASQAAPTPLSEGFASPSECLPKA